MLQCSIASLPRTPDRFQAASSDECRVATTKIQFLALYRRCGRLILSVDGGLVMLG